MTVVAPGRVHPVVLLASLANVVVLADATIVVVALPSLGADLGFSAGGLPWVVNSYSMAFGGCLILGGYAADRLGPRLPFALGMALFALGSFACAAAGSPAALVLGRVLQGVGGALFSPAALAVVTGTAVTAVERVRALAVWSGAGAAAVAVGPVLGGVLTGALGWPAVFWLPALGCLAAAGAGVRHLPRRTARSRMDSPRSCVDGAAVRVGVAGAVLALGSAALVGASYAATLWVQDVLRLSPGRAGLALLPLSAGIVLGAAVAPALTRWRGERPVAVAGLLAAAAGLLLLLPTPVLVPLPVLLAGLAVVAVGFGLQSVPVSALATAVPRRPGLASAAYQASGQLGGGLGLLVLVGVAAAVTGSVGGDGATVAGFHAIFAAGAGALLLAALVAGLGFRQVPGPDGDRDAVDADRTGHRRHLRGEDQLGPDHDLLAGREPDLGRGRRVQVGRGWVVPPYGGADVGVPGDGVATGQLGPQRVADHDRDPPAEQVAGDLPARGVGHPVRTGHRPLDRDRLADVRRARQPEYEVAHLDRGGRRARPDPGEGGLRHDHP